MTYVSSFRFLRKTAAFLLLALAGSPAPAKGHEPLPARLDGTMMPYDFSRVEPRPEVPDSLTPFYIDYVARHGARFLSSEKKVTAIEKTLAGQPLSGKGKGFLRLLEKVKRTTAGDWGALNATGREEQQRLAGEMSAMWPEVTGTGTVNAVATYVPRVIMSMYCFCHELARLNPTLDIYTGEGHRYDPLLRYFTTNPAYVSYLSGGDWKAAYKAFEDSIAPEGPARRLLGRHTTLSPGKLRKLTMDMYAILQSLRAAGLGAPSTEWMTLAEYRACWEASNLEHWLERTVTPFSAIPAIAAAPLAEDLIRTADEASQAYDKGKMTVKAGLRFGHAETLIPLLSLMNLPGCSPLPLSLDEVAGEWIDSEVSPLGANLEIVFFKSPTMRTYAAMRLNGRNIPPLPGKGLFVEWQELKDYWRHRLEALSSRSLK